MSDQLDISKLNLSDPEDVARLYSLVPSDKISEVMGYLLVDTLETFIKNKDQVLS